MNTTTDLLADARWLCATAAVGSTAAPRTGWIPAWVPGTAAQAQQQAGNPEALGHDYDGEDWWWRCEFTVAKAGPHTLTTRGIATYAEVLVDDIPLIETCNMFVSHQARVELPAGVHTIEIHCRSLQPILERRRPRPRWKSPDLVHQNLRWIRTTLQGRQIGGVAAPAPVGPWRPITLCPADVPLVRRTRLHSECATDGTGIVEIAVELRNVDNTRPVLVRVGDTTATCRTTQHREGTTATARVELGGVERWWPHTHGPQPLYEVAVTVDGTEHALGHVGFRTISVDRTDGAFALLVNGVRIFARGACWSPTDPISLQDDRLRQHLTIRRDGGHNIVRLSGTGVYPTSEFLDLCDELGLLVWQDCMLAFFDAPDDEEFAADLRAEVEELLDSFAGRPCLAVVCGSSDAEEQAAYLGLPPEKWVAPVAAELIPHLVEQLAPGTPYVRSSPGESPLPSMVNAGPSHYYGVGAYLQPTTDARRASVRFASECLCMACPAETEDSIEGVLAQRRLGHHPAWKSLIHRDAQSSWDLEDIREWYTQHLFGLDPIELRRADSERASAVARATVATVFEDVLSEWRRPGSGCAGAIVFDGHDVGFGGGIGIVDGHGRPKAPWYVMRRLMQPVAVMLTDEGVNGLGIHIANDGPGTWDGELRIDLVREGGSITESTTHALHVPPPGVSIEMAAVLGEFRDISYVHRFGPPAYDVVTVSLVVPEGMAISQASFLAGERIRPIDHGLSLEAVAHEEDEETWRLKVSTARFAQWVQICIDGWQPEDSWFHLLPGTERSMRLTRRADALPGPPRGDVTAINAAHPTRIAVAM